MSGCGVKVLVVVAIGTVTWRTDTMGVVDVAEAGVNWAMGCVGGSRGFSSSTARKLVIPIFLFLDLVDKGHKCFL